VKARDALDSGRIGRLVSIRALVGEHLPDVRPDYRNLFSAQHGGAFDLMHEIDLAIWYAGQPVREVRSLSGTYSDIGIVAPDLAEILIDFEGHCLASVHLDFFQRPRRRQIELIGTGGVIVVEFARWDRCTVSLYEAARGAWEHEELVTDRDDMFRAEDKEFLRAVAEDRTIRCTIAEARKSVEVVLACQN
jgi:predicted dehydrogenase